MSTTKLFKHETSNNGYFENLPKGTQAIIKDLILEAASDRKGPDGWRSDDECIDTLECHSRDGFTAFDHNRGGLVYKNFASLLDYWGGGYSVAHAKADKEMQRQIEYSLNAAQEGFLSAYGHILADKGLTPNEANYHSLYETNDPELEMLAEKLSEFEYENLGDEGSSIMHEFRFMYHGKDSDGMHSASVSAAVNTEGPYHRSSISWAPNVFCEGSKEVEITWTNQAELKRKLARALKTVSKEVF